MSHRWTWIVFCVVAVGTAISTVADDSKPARIYQNQLRRVVNPEPLLADHVEFIHPVEELHRFEAPRLVDDPVGDLAVRAWRYSYHARGVIEMPNHLDAERTAIIVVHPWGVDDGQGWRTPEPAGAAFACTPEKNRLMLRHAREVVDPLLKRLRDRVGLVMYSLPGDADPIRSSLYRTIHGTPAAEQRELADQKLRSVLAEFDYRGRDLPATFELSGDQPVADYFRAFPGLRADASFNHEGFWDLPVPVMNAIEVDADDVVIFDAQGYEALKSFLQSEGIRHILLCGYHADMCVCSTTAGYENLKRDFNVFLVGDAVQATFPANTDARHATNQAVSFASLELLITQASWIRLDP